jgi:hypothetical protein
MSLQEPVSKNNPLAGFMRQPKIYIKLPSGGMYWAPKSLEKTETDEYPVYSMTAKDELMFKTPDALLNGQAVVEVIQSCMPNIKNAWMIPTIDLDTILISIRMATYGERMSFSTKIPVINEDFEFDADLRGLLDQQYNLITWEEEIKVSDDLTVYVRPLTYKHMTQVSIKSFETNRILNMVNDESIADEKKLEIFNSSFANLTQVTVDLLADSIFKISAQDTEVIDPRHIKEFIANADKDVFETIKKHIDYLKERNTAKPFVIQTTPEQQEAGAPASFEIPINFNNSDFFG